MRFVADERSPLSWLTEICRRGLNPADCYVLLNGVECTVATAADDEEGWVDRIARDENGDMRVREDGNGPVIERVFGRVEFVFGKRCEQTGRATMAQQVAFVRRQTPTGFEGEDGG